MVFRNEFVADSSAVRYQAKLHLNDKINVIMKGLFLTTLFILENLAMPINCPWSSQVEWKKIKDKNINKCNLQATTQLLALS